MCKVIPNDLVVWFDDDCSRQARSGEVENASGCKVEFRCLDNKDVYEDLRDALSQLQEPCLVLMDHLLTHEQEGPDGLVRRGSDIVPLLRGTWAHTPVVAVTGAQVSAIGSLNSESYEEIVEYDNLSGFLPMLQVVISGYRQLGQKRDIERLVELIGCPDDDLLSLRAIMPSELRESENSPDFLHQVYRWFRREFHAYAGLLYDRDWTALLTGIAPEHFRKYEANDLIQEAGYQKLFADPEEPRWWKSLLYRKLLPDRPRRLAGDVRDAAQDILKVDSAHRSKCSVCGEDWPEVMGYPDTVEKTQRPMHLRCSERLEGAQVRPYYEDERIQAGSSGQSCAK